MSNPRPIVIPFNRPYMTGKEFNYIAEAKFGNGKNVSQDFDARAEFEIAPWINWLLERTLDLECWLIGKGLSFPWGGSRCLLARRP